MNVGEVPLTLLLMETYITDIPSSSGRIHSEFFHLLFLQDHRETDRFFAVSGVQLTQTNSDDKWPVPLLSCVVLRGERGLVMTAVLRVNLNLDREPITSRTHTHPSHSQTSRLLTSSLFLGVPVPRVTRHDAQDHTCTTRTVLRSGHRTTVRVVKKKLKFFLVPFRPSSHSRTTVTLRRVTKKLVCFED
jgi:hypothetical protein